MKKKLMTVLALVLVAAMSVAGTYAYLTSTASVENTFTVGNVSITMDEKKVDVYGTAVTPEMRVAANSYKLMPGHSYIKDPTVHVAAGSEACYVFVKVENGIAAFEASDNKIAAQITSNGWTALTGTTNVYYKQVNSSATQQDLAVFSGFKIADNAEDVTGWGNATITVNAYAVQYDGFADASAAWSNTFGK